MIEHESGRLPPPSALQGSKELGCGAICYPAAAPLKHKEVTRAANP